MFLAIGAPRALVDEEFARDSYIEYSRIFKGVKHIQSFVHGVDYGQKLIHLTNDSTLEFDVLVLATGRNYPAPYRLEAMRAGDSNDRAEMTSSQDSFHPEVYSREQLLKKLSKQRKKLAESQQAIVVGGGATGVETAAEIKVKFPNKPVTLYHSKSRLLISQRQVKESDSEVVLRKLQAMGVQVKLNTYFNEEQHGGENSFVVQAKGGSPNTKFLPESWVTDEGFVKCDKNLNLVGLKSVFALGDIVLGAEPTVITAKMLHVPVVAENILRVLNEEPKLKAVGKLAAPLASFLVVPLGPNDGLRLGLVGKMMGGMIMKDHGLARARKELIVN